jgi:uncharacterized protein
MSTTTFREHQIRNVSLSIDEMEGGNPASSFTANDKDGVTAFLTGLMRAAYRDRYPLAIREVERVARILTGGGTCDNEQVDPWAVAVVAANGDVTSFSPEFMEVRSAPHGDFRFGNILDGALDEIAQPRLSAAPRRRFAPASMHAGLLAGISASAAAARRRTK